MKTNVLIKQFGDSVNVIAVSDNEELLSERLVKEVSDELTDRFGERNELDPETDDYVIALWDALDNCTGRFWSDEDDEIPIEYYIVESEKI